MPYSERLVVISGSSHPALATALAQRLGLATAKCILETFPDGECHVELNDEVQDKTAILVQTAAAPIGEHLLELALLADACRRAGARELTAVIPYFPYARQDRRKRRGEPLGVRVAAELLAAMGLSRALTFELHSAAAEAASPFPIEELHGAPLLARAIAGDLPRDAVVVGPDLGATKLAQRYARELGTPMALVYKTRTSGSEVVAERVIGDVRGLSPILVDDIIASGGTMVAAARALLEAGCRPAFTVVATHAVLAEPALKQLAQLPVERLVVTNTLPVRGAFPFDVRQIDVSSAIASALTAA
jgi:ribose-phosphate pyrophosphokinase